jgi:hypothetical protein
MCVYRGGGGYVYWTSPPHSLQVIYKGRKGDVERYKYINSYNLLTKPGAAHYQSFSPFQRTINLSTQYSALSIFQPISAHYQSFNKVQRAGNLIQRITTFSNKSS